MQAGNPRRVHTPTVLQMESVECGAACLAIVLGYYGRIVPLEELRAASGVSRDGSKASNLVKAAAQYGLEAHGYSEEIEDLSEQNLPLIIFWNFNHFVVVEGFGKGVFYINDPASGPRRVTNEEFDECFTGVVLSFSPTREFRKGGQKRGLLAPLRRRLAGSEWALLYAVLAGLGLVVPGLVIPTFFRIFVDGFLIGRRTEWMVPLLAGMALTLVVRAALVALQEKYLMRLQTKLAISTASKFFWHVLHLPIEFFTHRYGGEIGSRLPINDTVADLLSGQLARTMLDLVMVVFFGLLLLWYDVPLTVIGIGVALLNVAALSLFSRRRIDANRRWQQDAGKLMGASMNGLQTIETLKAGGREADFFTRWAGYQSKVINVEQQLAVYDRRLQIISGLLSVINLVAVLTIGSLKIMNGTWTVGMLVAYQSLMASFLAPFNGLIDLGSTLQNLEGAMNRLDDVLRHAQEQTPQPVSSLGVSQNPENGRPLLHEKPSDQEKNAQASGEKAIRQQAAHLDPQPESSAIDPRLFSVKRGSAGPVSEKLIGHLELRNVTFGYSRLDAPLIDNFSLLLEPGRRVALVGGSGSGKSTVARLVCGLYEPWTGQVLMDGRLRQTFSREVLANSLALVDQDIFLFEGTVRDNLTLWDETVPEDQIIRAAKEACIHDDIAARPGAYDSMVSEGGSNFSGGQRQRLEIARALVGNPTLLILDEATSALDPVTENKIDANLRRRGCTCLIMAHRLSTIRDCDEIIVLKFGRVLQRGSHDSLSATPGPYVELLQAE